MEELVAIVLVTAAVGMIAHRLWQGATGRGGGCSCSGCDRRGCDARAGAGEDPPRTPPGR